MGCCREAPEWRELGFTGCTPGVVAIAERERELERERERERVCVYVIKESVNKLSRF